MVEYFQNELIGDYLRDTGHNLLSFAQDILKNRRQAAYFSYARPSESGWYDKGQIKSWFYVTGAERFTFARVYLNAMGDDANYGNSQERLFCSGK